MSLTAAFVAYLEDSGVGTLGEDLFVGGAPSSDQAPDAIWWIKTNGGTPIQRLSTGEMLKNYQVQVFRRDVDRQAIEDDLFSLEEELNAPGPIELTGFTTTEVTATTFATDQDLDSEDRMVGMLQATIKTYKENSNVIS